MVRWLALSALLFAVVPLALAQNFPGTELKASVPISQLPDDYYPVKVKELGGEMNGMSMASIMTLAMMGAMTDGEDSTAVATAYQLISTSWTNGSTVKLYGQELLVTYVYAPTPGTTTDGMADMKPESLVMTLRLVNPANISSIEAVPGLDRVSFVKALGELANSGGGQGVSAVPASAKTTSMSNIKQLGTATMIYLADYDDEFPYVESTPYFQSVVYPYCKNREVFRSLNPNGPGDFRYNVGVAGLNATVIEDVSEMPLLYDPKPWPDGTYLVCFCDSHCEFVDAERWEYLKTIMRPKLPRSGKPVIPPLLPPDGMR